MVQSICFRLASVRFGLGGICSVLDLIWDVETPVFMDVCD